MAVGALEQLFPTNLPLWYHVKFEGEDVFPPVDVSLVSDSQRPCIWLSQQPDHSPQKAQQVLSRRRICGCAEGNCHLQLWFCLVILMGITCEGPVSLRLCSLCQHNQCFVEHLALLGDRMATWVHAALGCDWLSSDWSLNGWKWWNSFFRFSLKF